MSKQPKNSNTRTQSKRIVASQSHSTGILNKLESWLEPREKKILLLFLFLSTIFSLLLFDTKVSMGGDDSSYIERAWMLLKEGKYPYFQGPGYPVFLSLFVKMFGLNVIALKFFSVICQLGFVCFTYLTFRKRVPYLVLFALISFISLNNFIQYYASQTFTETFFLFVQSICLYVTFNIIDDINTDLSLIEGFKKNYKKWLLFGLMFVLLTISKSIAFVTLGGVIIYFLIHKNYKQIVYAILVFLVIRIIYQLIISTFFGANESNQLEMMLRKDLYKPEGGHEDLSGMIDRFFNNFNTYISLHMYRLMNLRSFEYDASKIIPPLSYISTIILGIFSLLSYKKNKYVFFCSIYLAVLCGGIFFGVQANNMQDRLIIIVIPLIFLVLFYGMWQLMQQYKSFQTIFLLFASAMLIVTISKSAMQAKLSIPVLIKNLSGEQFYGMTPDWINFLKMSKYCADSLPDSVGVLSRKPTMSFLYGNGKKFIGQFWATSTNADSVLMGWQKQKVKYVMLPSLRMDPKKNNGRIINNIHRMLQPVYAKYPQKIKLVKSIGTDEKCDLYEINY